MRPTHLRTLLLWVLLAPAWSAPLAAQEITGTWQMTVELDVGSGEPTFIFEQTGEELTGSYQGTFGSAAVSGRISGNEVEFWFEMQGTKATYLGTFSRDTNTMKGTCDYGSVGKGTWEGERIE